MPEQDESFDPYRFGHPDVPPPPEFAPPGYRPPTGPPPPGPPPPGQPPAGPPPAAVELRKGTPYPGTPPPAAPYDYGAPSGYPGYPYPPYQTDPRSYGRTSGKAIAGLVLGILSIVLFWLTIFDVVFVVLALIFGILGLNEANARGIRGRGQAIAGLICAGLGAVLAITLTVLFVRAADKCGGLSNQDDPGFQKCVERHLLIERP